MELAENIRARLKNMAMKKYGSLPNASRAMGKCNSYLNGKHRINSVQTVYNICKSLDISFKWVMTGFLYSSFHEDNIKLSGFKEFYKMNFRKTKQKIAHHVYEQLNRGVYNITLKKLQALSEFYGVSMYFLVTGNISIEDNSPFLVNRMVKEALIELKDTLTSG